MHDLTGCHPHTSYLMAHGSKPLPTRTAKLLLQVYARYNFRFFAALGKYNAHVLFIPERIAFERIRRTGPVIQVAFRIIDAAVFHDVFNLLLGNVPALHAAFGMRGILKL